MIGRAFYSATASTDDIFDEHSMEYNKKCFWSELPTPPLIQICVYIILKLLTCTWSKRMKLSHQFKLQ